MSNPASIPLLHCMTKTSFRDLKNLISSFRCRLASDLTAVSGDALIGYTSALRLLSSLVQVPDPGGQPSVQIFPSQELFHQLGI